MRAGTPTAEEAAASNRAGWTTLDKEARSQRSPRAGKRQVRGSQRRRQDREGGESPGKGAGGPHRGEGRCGRRRGAAAAERRRDPQPGVEAGARGSARGGGPWGARGRALEERTQGPYWSGLHTPGEAVGTHRSAARGGAASGERAAAARARPKPRGRGERAAGIGGRQRAHPGGPRSPHDHARPDRRGKAGPGETR